MKQLFFTPLLVVMLALPCQSETPKTKEGVDLVQRGLELLFQELLKEVGPTIEELESLGEDLRPKILELLDLIDDIQNYDTPEKLPNGDIIIRRKDPLEEGEIEL